MKHLATGKPLVYVTGSLLVLVVLIAGTFAWLSPSLPVPAAPLEKVTLAVNTAYAGSCPVFVAQEKGYFSGEGLMVTIQSHTTGKASLDAALHARADLATVAEIPILFAALKGEPVLVLATIFTANKDLAIVARKDRGVLVPANLKGKNVGVTLGTTGHFLLDAFLIRQKLSPTEVTTRDLPPTALAGALGRGEVDAIVAWEPFLGQARELLGANASVYYGDGIYESSYNIAGAREYVVTHPQATQKLLRALIQGARFCRENADEALAISAKAMQADTSKVSVLWPNYRFRVSLDQSLLLGLEDGTRWAIKHKLTTATAMPNYLDYLHLDALRAVAPTAVTVIH